MKWNNSKLEWDNDGERFYETGVKFGVLYPLVDGAYSKGYVWNGLTAVTESPSGAEANPIYADDMKYLELRSAEEFGATVEAYTYPDEFAECDGSAAVATGVVAGQQVRKKFGLCYRTVIGNDTDMDAHGYKIHLIYGAMAAPSERAYQTINDSPEAITFSWELTTTPVTIDGFKPSASLIIDSTKADAAALAELETILYGFGSTDARLPLPNEVIEIMGGAASYDVVLNRATAGVKVGRSFTLRATTVPADEPVTWASSDDTKATVSDGKVTGVEAGNATITASFEKNGVTYSDTCKVTVSAE